MEDAIKESQRQLGAEHPTTLTIKSNLASAYEGLGRKTDVERIWKEVLEARQTFLGDKHPETLHSMAALGNFYMTNGRLDAAAGLFLKAAGLKVAASPSIAIMRLRRIGGDLGLKAVVYSKKMELKKLEPVLKEAAQIARERNGPDHAHVVFANSSLASLYLYWHDYAKAEPYFRDLLASWNKNGAGPGNRNFSELQYGICLLAQKKNPEAKSHLLAGYNGIRPGQEAAPPQEGADLGSLISHVLRLRDANGRRLSETALSIIHKDPKLEGMVLDLQFPAEPFVSR